MRKVRVRASFHAFALLLAMAVVPLDAQTYSVLYNFGTNPGDPLSPEGPNLIAQGRDGSLYSTAPYGGTGICNGGAPGCGAVFRIGPGGQFDTLYSFTGSTDGYFPYGGLTLGTDGNFYGTTTSTIGECSNIADGRNGTIFKITPDGTLTTLYVFAGGSDGGTPQSPPVQSTDGNFYGTTTLCGNVLGGFGTFYRLTPGGVFTTLHRFTKAQRCGYSVNPAMQGTDGNFYVAAPYGPLSRSGAICKISTTGKVTVLSNFSDDPNGPLVQGADGALYGTTRFGGALNGGTIFKVTTGGQVTTLYSLNGASDGITPIGALVLAADGNFYGTAAEGGTNNDGTLFSVSPTGSFAKLYDFQISTGYYPQVTLLQHTNGLLYGQTFCGGAGHGGQCNSGGVFYSLNALLAPFVAFVPAQKSGKVGASVGILGQGLLGTTSVTFGGIAAIFTVSSDTFLTAAVPSGALTGPVSVNTSSAALTSNANFRVTPVIKKFTPTSGPPGTTVVITGVSLTQTTQVSFGGVPANSFTVNSDNLITAIVPPAAVTGKISVTTLGGVAAKGNFTVN